MKIIFISGPLTTGGDGSREYRRRANFVGTKNCGGEKKAAKARAGKNSLILMIKTIIFDADGVVIHREMCFSQRFSKEFGVPYAVANRLSIL